jgi:glutathione S-transferase
MEGELGKSEWFAGPAFSTADIQMSFPLEAARVRGGLDEKRPRLMAYLQKIHSRPAYLRALERGGKYELLR